MEEKTIELPSGKILDYSRSPLIMGILNVTPDSFFEESRAQDLERALERVEVMVSEGVDIVDVGGESTRPGAAPVPLEEELHRVLPVVEEIKKNFEVPISVDTYKAEVARKAIENGAEIVNDVSALRFDPNMREVVSRYDVPVVVMHMKGTPGDMQKNPFYEDVICEIMDFLKGRVEYLRVLGISEKRIILDPGIGFGKRYIDNIEILRNIESFVALGFPILVGHSRKSFLGQITGEPPEGRLEATIGVSVYLALKGVAILRVHDVGENKKAIKVLEAIYECSGEGKK